MLVKKRLKAKQVQMKAAAVVMMNTHFLKEAHQEYKLLSPNFTS